MLRLAFTGISLEVYPEVRGGVRYEWAEPLLAQGAGLVRLAHQGSLVGATAFQCRARAGALGAVLAADTAGPPACPPGTHRNGTNE